MNGTTDGRPDPNETINSPSETPVPATPRSGPAAVSCPTCGSPGSLVPAVLHRSGHPWVYAFGRIEPRFPSIGVEKEFAQLATRSRRPEVDDAALVRSVLGQEEGRYLARHLTWVLVAHERDAFVIVPRDRSDLDQLIEASGPTESDRLCLVTGRSTPGGWWAPDSGEPGLARYGADQIIPFEVDDFVSKVHRPEDVPEAPFRDTVRSLFTRIRRRSGNTGEHDDSRALNYMALRYGAMYEVAGREATRGMRLAGIDASLQLASDGRRHAVLRFRFRNVSGELAETYGCRIDVTEQFPFIASPMRHVFDA